MPLSDDEDHMEDIFDEHDMEERKTHATRSQIVPPTRRTDPSRPTVA
jgi:hypothetical protein